MIQQNDNESNIESKNQPQKLSTPFKYKSKLKEFFFSGKTSTFSKEQNNNLKVSLYFLLIGFVVVHSLVVQQLISSQSYGKIFLNLVSLLRADAALYQTLFSILVLIKILLILAVSIEIIYKVEVFVLSWVARRFMESFLLIKQFDLASSAFMMIINWQQGIVLLFISTLINIFQAVYLQNYVIRKDYLYISSAYHHLSFRAFIIFTYYGNIVFFVLGNELKFYQFSSFIGVLHLIWYLKQGHNQFIHSFSNALFMILNAVFITVHIVFAQKFILGLTVVSTEQIFRMVLILAVVIFLLYYRSLPTIDRLPKHNQQSSKEIDIQFKRLLESAFNDKNVDSKLIGILQMHQFVQCNNCSTMKQKLYDPLLKVQVEQSQIYLQKQTAVMYYVKEIYEKYMEKDDAEICIDYCQFLCNEYNHYFLALKELQRVRFYSLNIIQKIKITQMENYLIKQHQKLNKELYNGVLEIEHIVESEDCFHVIEGMIRHYIAKNLHVWKSLGEQEIELSQLRATLKKEFAMLTQIQFLWKKNSRFFTSNKAWLFIYIHYMLFVKNERIKQKETDFFNNTESAQESIFSHQTIYFDAKQKSEKLFNPLIMFNYDTCCLTAVCEVEKLIIRRVNNTFSRVTGYEEQEIVGSRVEVLMPTELANSHYQQFHYWLQEGYISNENSFNVLCTNFVTKDQRVIPAFKYYKAHCHIDNGVEFVCLIKSNHKPAVVETKCQMKWSYAKRNTSTNEYINRLKLGKQFAENQQKGRVMESNIFIKEESLQPKKSFKQIQCFKLFSRMFIFLMVASILILSKITLSDAAQLNNYSNQFITIMSMYRYPVVLGISYMKNFLNIGNIVKVNGQIQFATNNMLISTASKPTKTTIFDESLNPNRMYYPYYNYSFLQNDSLSGIDLFYTMVSAISSLNQTYINRTSRQYQRFNSYLKPSYDTMMNTTKYKLHQTFGNIFSASITKQICFMIGQAALFIFFSAILVNLVKVSFQKMKNILMILLDFNANQIEDVHKYWKDVAKSFNILFMQLHRQSKANFKYISLSKLNFLIESENREAQVSLNKKSKNAAQDKEQNLHEFILKFKIILVLLVVASLMIGSQFYTLTEFKLLRNFQQDGFFFLKYFPAEPLIALGCVQRYYSQLYPSQLEFNPQKYDDALLAAKKFGSGNDYIGEVSDASSQYYAKQKNYFFGSPCEYNPSILMINNMPISKCLSICNGTMKQGLSSYLRYLYKQSSMCISNQIKLTPAELDELTIGITIHTNYVFDALTTWANQFAGKMEHIQTISLNTSLIILGGVVLIHLLMKEHRIIGFLDGQYEFIKKMYVHLVPEFILINEKVIRQKFIISGIISS